MARADPAFPPAQGLADEKDGALPLNATKHGLMLMRS
jgi:hypothetical protein